MSPALPTLSLVIPTHDRAGLIAATLDSALAQTLPFHEIIVVDDGSTDGTADVLARYAGRIRTIRVPKGGVQRARNVGVAAASGDYVALCDSDDLLEPGYVAALSAWLAGHPGFDAIYNNFVLFDSRGTGPDKFSLAPAGWFDGARRSGAFLHDVPDLYARTVAFQPLVPSGSLARKTFYERIGGYDPRFYGVGSEDWEFTLRVIGEGRVALGTAPLVRIRKHLGNTSADNLRQVSGCAQILEYALANHAHARPYRDLILDSIDRRREQVFEIAFARGNFEMANQMLQRLRSRRHGVRFHLKAWIAHLPRIVREPLWRVTQRGREDVVA